LQPDAVLLRLIDPDDDADDLAIDRGSDRVEGKMQANLVHAARGCAFILPAQRDRQRRRVVEAFVMGEDDLRHRGTWPHRRDQLGTPISRHHSTPSMRSKRLR
jgi:hypothetical protein